MSTDRELLELAAKAVGMHVLVEGKPWPKEKIGWFFNQVGDNPPVLYDRASPSLAAWAPLTDDGDALRLALKLDIGITFEASGSVMAGISEGGSWVADEDIGDDKARATRRAIVRAAALSGKAMP